MNFQIVQKAIQNGWDTDIDDFDYIYINGELQGDTFNYNRGEGTHSKP